MAARKPDYKGPERRKCVANCGTPHKAFEKRLAWGQEQFKSLSDGQKEIMGVMQSVDRALRGDVAGDKLGICHEIATIKADIKSLQDTRTAAGNLAVGVLKESATKLLVLLSIIAIGIVAWVKTFGGLKP